MKIKSFTIPKKNKEIFIDPAYENIPELIDLNKKSFQSYDCNINGIPFSQFREQVRSDTLKKAGEYSENLLSLCSNLNIAGTKNFSCVKDFYSPEKNIIQTGHSPAIVHPGVLIKHSLVNRIAKKVNGIGINMVVDNDAGNDNCLNIPDINDLGSSVEKMEYHPGLRNLAFEEIRYADSTQLPAFKENVLKSLHNPDMLKTLEDFMNVVIKLSGETLQFSDLFTFARHAFATRFGIRNLEVPVSLISETDPFLNFFLHITANVKCFVDIYNSKLREYRKLKKISSKANPLPDLMEKGFVIEMPFWIWEEGKQRKSLYASVSNGSRISILCENKMIEHFDFGEMNRSTDNLKNLERLKALISKGIKIRPKAIANTMYSRMFFSDLFIHGIGGAKYDLITNEIIREFFGVEPPEYATISATLYLPYKPFDVSDEDINKMKHAVKDMGYNPDRYASRGIMEDAGMISLINEKKDLISRGASDSKEKHLTFDRIKQLNSLMKDKISPLIKKSENEIADLEKKLSYNSIVTNRNYPFCLYPEAMLRELFKLS